MKDNLVDITLVLDRSGSMSACREEAENGVNHFIEEQKKVSGECNLTLIQFDTEYEFIHVGKPIKTVPKFELIPRGMTALLDAIGRAINETGERLSKLSEEQRPESVIFLIVTDGEENSSHKFKKSQIKEMIEHQQKAYSWNFVFLGANQDAFVEASGYGIPAYATAQYTTNKISNAFDAISKGVVRTRGALRTRGATGQSVSWSFTDEERKEMNK